MKKRFPLPTMQCDSGCGDCCGPVLCRQDEFRAVLELAAAKGVDPVRQGETCPWYQGGGCTVYEARPEICRLFGHSPRLVCSRGYNVNIPPMVEKRIMSGYEPVMLLHQVFDDWREVVTEKRLKLNLDGSSALEVKP
jgi:hypothetical protein